MLADWYAERGDTRREHACRRIAAEVYQPEMYHPHESRQPVWFWGSLEFSLRPVWNSRYRAYCTRRDHRIRSVSHVPEVWMRRMNSWGGFYGYTSDAYTSTREAYLDLIEAIAKESAA